MIQRALRGFIIGSSLAATIFPIAGLGIAGRELPVGTVNWLLICLFFPILFGLTNVLTVTFSNNQSFVRMLGIGALMGLVSASIGTFTLNLPEIVYGLQGNRRYLALLLGPVFYGLVWAIVVRWINKLFALDTN